MLKVSFVPIVYFCFCFMSELCFFMCRPSEKAQERKETLEQELLMKGPGTFPLERLLAIFQCLVSVAEEPSDEEEQNNDGLGVEGGNGGLMSDILLQLSSLCNSNFIFKGRSCPIEGSTRYRSTISEDLALKVTSLSHLTPSKFFVIVYVRRLKYTSTKNDAFNFVKQVARSLEFPLSKYLYRS